MANDKNALVSAPAQGSGISDPAMTDAIDRRAKIGSPPATPPILAGMILLVATPVRPKIPTAAGHTVGIRRVQGEVEPVHHTTGGAFSRWGREANGPGIT